MTLLMIDLSSLKDSTFRLELKKVIRPRLQNILSLE